MGIFVPGFATGNVPAQPHTPSARPRPNVHGTAPPISGNQALGAPPLGAEGPDVASPPRPTFWSRLATWKVPVLRRVADGLWVLAAVSPTLALSAAPTLAWLCPTWSWPLVAIGVGLTLFATMALCMYGISLLERLTGGRPPPSDLRRPAAPSEAGPAGAPSPGGPGKTATPDGAVPPTPLPPQAPAPAPHGYTVLNFQVPAYGPAAPRASTPLPPGQDAACRETTRLMADTATVDAEQRNMRVAMTCAAYAKPEPGSPQRVPWHREAWCAPDGMSYNAIFSQERGRYADLMVVTVAEGLGILSGDLTGRNGLSEWLGGLYGGIAPDLHSYRLLGGEIGGAYAGTHMGGRINGGVNDSTSESKQSRNTRHQDAGAFVGTGHLEGEHAVEHVKKKQVGANVVPSWSWGLNQKLPLRTMWRRDRKVIDTETTVLEVPTTQLDSSAPLPARSLAQPHLLRAADSFDSARNAYYGSLLAGNVLLTFAGRHHMRHDAASLHVRCDGYARVRRNEGSVWLPRLELTFVRREQHGARWLASVSGGIGADSGRRTFDDERQIIHLVGQPELGAPLQALWDTFGADKDPRARTEAWRAFVARRGVKVRREISAGTVHNREAGVTNLPACAGYLTNNFGLELPDGFGRGLLPWQKSRGEVDITMYAEAPLEQKLETLVPQRLVRAFWRQPSGEVAGPRGERSQMVAAQLERGPGCGVKLKLLSRWSMSRADSGEVEGYILRPLRKILDQPEAQDVAGMLDAAGWRASAVAHWRTSRQVDLDSSFDAQELGQLSLLRQEDWRILGDRRGLEARSGFALSQQLQLHLGALQQTISAQDPAWQALGVAAARFVAATHLAAPGLLRQALALPGPTPRPWPGAASAGLLVLRTESGAYNERAKNYEAFWREAQHPERARAKGFANRVQAERAACSAAEVQAAHDPFLEPLDRVAYAAKLRRYQARLGELVPAA